MSAYNLSSFAGAGAQFFDDNGDPLSGGKVYTYTAGTTTPAATYTTSAGSVANTNPIILDAAGRTPNEIWLTVGVLYKFIVKTSNDVLVGTYDNLPSINDPYSINSLLGSVTGTNTIAAVATPAITTYVTGATYAFIAANTNTGASTLSIDGLTAKSITKNGTVALSAGDLQAGKLMWVQYDGTAFQLINNIIYGGSITNATVNSLATPLGVANGGTGAATLAANAVVLGNGVAAVQTVAPNTANNALISDGTTWISKPLAAPVVGGYSALKVQATGNTSATVSATAIILGATAGTYQASNVSLTLSTSSTGANALDTGTVAASTWYSVWVIYNPGDSTAVPPVSPVVAGLLSTSATAPTLPTGYTYKARVGWIRTDGSSNLYQSIQYGNRAQWIMTGTTYQAIASGSTTSAWSAYAIANYAPTTASAVTVILRKDSNNAAAAASPNNSPTVSATASSAPLWVGNNSSAGLANALQGTFMIESSNVYYWSATANAALYSQGWIDNL